MVYVEEAAAAISPPPPPPQKKKKKKTHTHRDTSRGSSINITKL